MVSVIMTSLLRESYDSGKVVMKMRKEYEKIGEIRETHSLRVSQQGEGLYLYLPKGLTEVHGIWAGDRIKVTLSDLFRPKLGNATLSEKRGISRNKKRKGEAEE